jgi:hypothetical protein
MRVKFLKLAGIMYTYILKHTHSEIFQAKRTSKNDNSFYLEVCCVVFLSYQLEKAN